jgi:cardiolipin synthase
MRQYRRFMTNALAGKRARIARVPAISNMGITGNMDQSSDTALERHEARHAPLSSCPILDGNAVRLLDSGQAAISAILDAIDAAQASLHLEYYIFSDVHQGDRSILKGLLAARARGVQVAVLYDSAGSHATPDAMFDQLEAAGAKTLEFRPLNPLRRHFAWHLNDRDHRKLMVADGNTAFMGGTNLSRVYENPPSNGVVPDSRKSFWHDCAIRVQGPAVESAQRIFLDTWNGNGGDTLEDRGFFPPLPPIGEQRMRIAPSKPLEKQQLYFTALLAAIHEARERILLTTGYFVPSRKHWQALADAANRGVEVSLLLGGHSDIPATLHAARALYGRLLAAGVHIHEIQDGLLHAKAATIDGVWTVIGSSNFDRRSFSFNNELDAVLLGRDMAGDVEAMLRRWMQRAEEVTLEDWRRRSVKERGQEYSARLWERYM